MFISTGWFNGGRFVDGAEVNGNGYFELKVDPYALTCAKLYILTDTAGYTQYINLNICIGANGKIIKNIILN